MPVALQTKTPPISQIYSAFSPESYSIFRTAMCYSRGGYVRIADVLAAWSK